MIITEASELLEIFRYKDEKQIKEIMDGEKRISVEEEVADVLFGVLRFAQMNNIDLSTALLNKIEKNNIKYPIELVKGKNKKYNEY
ncbi:MazG nucleotide pyrophosphohydrolase domain protein [compost metagenome]